MNSYLLIYLLIHKRNWSEMQSNLRTLYYYRYCISTVFCLLILVSFLNQYNFSLFLYLLYVFNCILCFYFSACL
jgi:ABC-type sugar transport system permease subunit